MVSGALTKLRPLAIALLGVALFGSSARAAGEERPSLIFILLDTTRADRLGAWGNTPDTTPVLDRLAERGVRFARHYANSHATRPSMPQLMSGRYYRDNILAAFQTNAHPREMSFAKPDPSGVLLPRLMREAGYATAGVSAHTWVAPDSELGRAFEHFELLPFSAKDAHGDAVQVVDRALALWKARDTERPLFLYLHFMDMHIPRRLPEGEPRHAVPGYRWQSRFRPDGEPDFDRARRGWWRYDASDFTPDDRAHYAAVYDTRLRHADTQLGRLFEAVEHDDPDLRKTMIVVTADHGEELGENGRIEHSASLADGVQHVPWIVAGGPLAPGQRCDQITEHVDVVPSVAAILGVALPVDSRVDGTSRFDGGTLRRPCGGRAAFYAWEEYRAVRLGHYVLAEYPDGSIDARCGGSPRLYRLDGPRQQTLPIVGTDRRAHRLQRLLAQRLDARERSYQAGRYDVPHVPFVVRTDFFQLAPEMPLRCVSVNERTPRATLLEPGWFTTGRGIALTRPDELPAAVDIELPPGSYAVEAAMTPIPPAPWLFGIGRWRRRAFRRDTPSEYRSLGTIAATSTQTRVDLPAGVLAGAHLIGLRLSPPGAVDAPPQPLDPAQRDRLRALGYID